MAQRQKFRKRAVRTNESHRVIIPVDTWAVHCTLNRADLHLTEWAAFQEATPAEYAVIARRGAAGVGDVIDSVRPQNADKNIVAAK
jgi:hypothetical protein